MLFDGTNVTVNAIIDERSDELKAEQAAMIDKTEEAEDPWYKEESDYMQVYHSNQLSY